MTWIVVDVEANGPCAGLHSMISFAAVPLNDSAGSSFVGRVAPVSDLWDEKAYSIVGTDYQKHSQFDLPEIVMNDFAMWLDNFQDKIVFISDNPAFDWQYINYYLHRFVGRNPFGYSARRIGDLYAGFRRDSGKSNEWKTLRKTVHSHDPLDDALGNREALLEMSKMGLKIPLR